MKPSKWFRQKRNLLKKHWAAHRIATEAEELGQRLPCWNYSQLKSHCGADLLRLLYCSPHTAACSACPDWGLGLPWLLWHHCVWKLDLDTAAYSARSGVFWSLFICVICSQFNVLAHVSACPSLSHIPVLNYTGGGKESIRNVHFLCGKSHKSSKGGKFSQTK